MTGADEARTGADSAAVDAGGGSFDFDVGPSAPKQITGTKHNSAKAAPRKCGTGLRPRRIQMQFKNVTVSEMIRFSARLLRKEHSRWHRGTAF